MMSLKTIVALALLATACGARVEPPTPEQCTPREPTKPLIVFDGNSLTYGLGSTPGHSYPDEVASLLGPSWSYENLGVGGQTTREMLSDVTTEVDDKHPAIVVAWELGNALYYWDRGVVARGQDPDAAYSDFVTYCQGRRAAGAKVIVLTVTPRSLDYASPTWDAAVANVNARLRTEWRQFSDGIADVAADPRLGPGSYIDGVHMNDSGYRFVGEDVASAVVGLPVRADSTQTPCHVAAEKSFSTLVFEDR